MPTVLRPGTKILVPEMEIRAFAPAAAVAVSPLLTSLVSYWKLDETSGTRNDSHGTNHLTDNNTVGYAAGKLSNAADFTAADSDYLSHVDNSDLSPAGNVNFTVAFWFDPVATFSTAALIGKYTGGGTNQDEYLVYYASQITFIIRATDDTAVAYSYGGALTAGSFYFVVCWRDGTNVYIQINNGTPGSSAWAKATKDYPVDFRIGRFGSTYSNAIVDEVGFWKRVLTADERTSLYNGGSGLAYPFS